MKVVNTRSLPVRPNQLSSSSSAKNATVSHYNQGRGETLFTEDEENEIEGYVGNVKFFLLTLFFDKFLICN